MTVTKKFLNVGGNNKAIAVPPIYAGWEHNMLDIDPRAKPDVLCDARLMTTLPPAVYDSVYCSHNLEHYFRHDVPKVLAGIKHVLKADGFLHLRVPDMAAVMQLVVQKNLDIEDALYQSPAGPISALDVIYGFGLEIERSGNDFFAHKTGFTTKSLIATLHAAGFPHVFVGTGNLEISAFAFTAAPNEYATALLQLS